MGRLEVALQHISRSYSAVSKIIRKHCSNVKKAHFLMLLHLNEADDVIILVM